MSYITKKDQVLVALDDFGLGEVFSIRDENSEGVLIQCEQNMGNGKCIISLQIENRVFNGIYYYLGKLNNIGKKDKMLELLNSFNEENLMLKFYLDEDSSIMGQVMYIASDDTFNANEYVSMIGSAYRTIEDNFYGKIMRVMWA